MQNGKSCPLVNDVCRREKCLAYEEVVELKKGRKAKGPKVGICTALNNKVVVEEPDGTA